MAISKEILNNKKKTNKPEPLGTVPENNPDHVSRPVDFHHPIPPKPILYNSFDEAVAACELIFLKPGEAHTEFYKIDNTYHCVVAIGNIYANHKHLYLTDSGNILSIGEQFALLKDEIIQLSKQFLLLDKHVDNLEDKINVFEENLN